MNYKTHKELTTQFNKAELFCKIVSFVLVHTFLLLNMSPAAAFAPDFNTSQTLAPRVSISEESLLRVFGEVDVWNEDGEDGEYTLSMSLLSKQDAQKMIVRVTDDSTTQLVNEPPDSYTSDGTLYPIPSTNEDEDEDIISTSIVLSEEAVSIYIPRIPLWVAGLFKGLLESRIKKQGFVIIGIEKLSKKKLKKLIFDLEDRNFYFSKYFKRLGISCIEYKPEIVITRKNGKDTIENILVDYNAENNIFRLSAQYFVSDYDLRFACVKNQLRGVHKAIKTAQQVRVLDDTSSGEAMITSYAKLGLNAEVNIVGDDMLELAKKLKAPFIKWSVIRTKNKKMSKNIFLIPFAALNINKSVHIGIIKEALEPLLRLRNVDFPITDVYIDMLTFLITHEHGHVLRVAKHNEPIIKAILLQGKTSPTVLKAIIDILINDNCTDPNALLICTFTRQVFDSDEEGLRQICSDYMSNYYAYRVLGKEKFIAGLAAFYWVQTYFRKNIIKVQNIQRLLQTFSAFLTEQEMNSVIKSIAKIQKEYKAGPIKRAIIKGFGRLKIMFSLSIFGILIARIAYAGGEQVTNNPTLLEGVILSGIAWGVLAEFWQLWKLVHHGAKADADQQQQIALSVKNNLRNHKWDTLNNYYNRLPDIESKNMFIFALGNELEQKSTELDADGIEVIENILLQAIITDKILLKDYYTLNSSLIDAGEQFARKGYGSRDYRKQLGEFISGHRYTQDIRNKLAKILTIYDGQKKERLLELMHNHNWNEVLKFYHSLNNTNRFWLLSIITKALEDNANNSQTINFKIIEEILELSFKATLAERKQGVKILNLLPNPENMTPGFVDMLKQDSVAFMERIKIAYITKALKAVSDANNFPQAFLYIVAAYLQNLKTSTPNLQNFVNEQKKKLDNLSDEFEVKIEQSSSSKDNDLAQAQIFVYMLKQILDDFENSKEWENELWISDVIKKVINDYEKQKEITQKKGVEQTQHTTTGEVDRKRVLTSLRGEGYFSGTSTATSEDPMEHNSQVRQRKIPDNSMQIGTIEITNLVSKIEIAI